MSPSPSPSKSTDFVEGAACVWNNEATMAPWHEESVHCWRDADCVEAEEVDVEHTVEVEVGRWRRDAQEKEKGNAGHYAPRYVWQEVEGVGGMMKGKKKVKVKIGGWFLRWGTTHREHGASGSLGASPSTERRRRPVAQAPREREGEARSWCGWCDRVVLGREDELIMMDTGMKKMTI